MTSYVVGNKVWELSHFFHNGDDRKLYNTISSKEDQICLQQVINRIKMW